jgi:2-polyprenyl-3-methyl-5-hydroxy-6-metoxy-1,4-benzoquinol methylase
MPFNEQLHRYAIAETWIGAALGGDWASVALLDVGCHNGTLCRMFVSRGARVTGIDDYPEELAAKEQWKYVRHNLNDVKVLPFPDASFAAITALEVLEHVIDTDFFLKELLRVLQPGGRLVISTPNINMLKNRLRVPLGLYPYGLEWHTVIHHVRLYNRATLQGHLQQTGFVVRQFRGTHLIPQRLLGVRPLLGLSNMLARWFPQLSSNFILESEKPGSPGAVQPSLAADAAVASPGSAQPDPRS